MQRLFSSSGLAMLDIKSGCTLKMSEIGKAKKKGKTESEAIALPRTTCEPSIDSTRNQAAVIVFPEVLPAQGMMSEAEARQHIDTIKLRFDDITALLLELDDRRGWEALKWVKNSSPTLKDVCDRVTRLWSVPNLPSSVQLLLSKFYQRELIFLQGDLDVLQAIERLYQDPSLKPA